MLVPLSHYLGKGVMGKLLNESFNIACQNENIGVFTAASESLYTFYEKIFSPFFIKEFIPASTIHGYYINY